MVWLYFTFIVGLHTLFAVLLIRGKWSNGWPLLSFMAMTILGLGFSFFNAPWFIYSYYIFVLICLLTLPAIFIGIKKLMSADWNWPGILRAGGSIFFLLSAVYFGNFLIKAVGSMSPPDDVVELEFPLRNGTYGILQGGADVPLQLPKGHSGTPSQIYAYDVFKLGSGGHSMSQWMNWKSVPLINSETVYAPCSGEAVWVRDGLPDNDVADNDQPAGNVVGIACKGVIVSLAHFNQNSITVKQGDQVSAGQPLGTIGSSGRSVFPHLHFHAERGPFKGDVSDNPGVAMTFDGRFLWKNGLIKN